MDYNRGLYFKSELECQRALAILEEEGFCIADLLLLSPYEATLHLQNKENGDRAIDVLKYLNFKSFAR